MGPKIFLIIFWKVNFEKNAEEEHADLSSMQTFES